ncbi:CDP-alcohol phosphatidyltransferase family protein [Candidatus Micrarchaeota archaeon]|nr:CDP-alcohol phosphatidyltransferase family protein [Candidatus Micrarchaeota archaeon]
MIKESGIGKEASTLIQKLFGWIPISPNTITILSVIFAVCGFASYSQNAWLSFGFFALALFSDAVDGAVAKAKNMQTKKGAFLDGVSDRIVEFFIILAMFGMVVPALYLEWETWLLILLFFGTGMTSFVKAYSEHSGILEHARALKMPGILERTERVLLIMVGFVLVVLGFGEYAIVVIAIAGILSLITIIQRIFYSLSN